MLKMGGRGIKNGKPVELMLIGLSHRNLEKLKEGQPIECSAADFGCSGNIQIVIFSGATEQQMARDMHELIGPKTEVRIDPRLRD